MRQVGPRELLVWLVQLERAVETAVSTEFKTRSYDVEGR